MKTQTTLATTAALAISILSSSAAVLVTSGATVGGTTVAVNLPTHTASGSIDTSINVSGNLVFAPKVSPPNNDFWINFSGLGLDTSSIRYVQIDFLTTSAGAVTGDTELFHTDDDSTIGGGNNSRQLLGQPAVNVGGPFSIVVDLVSGSPSGSGIGWGPGTANNVRFDLFQTPGNRGETFEISGVTFGSALVPEPSSTILIGLSAMGLFLRRRR